MGAEWRFQPTVENVESDQRQDEEDDDGDSGEDDNGEEAGLVGWLLFEVRGNLLQLLGDLVQLLVKFLLEVMGMCGVVLVCHVVLDAAPWAEAK